ncbi:MAG TPA: ATPase, T2SS/T4P/T4SS family [Candidatus Omnitrophota bacterium]|nr:ATPase, T2SS/T4P/T4SS family [Candidatus Omnitrophota bacterium]
MMKPSDKILFEALVYAGAITKERLQEFLRVVQASDEGLDAYLMRNGLVTKQQILGALQKTYKIETVDLASLSIEQPVIDRIPVKFAWYYRFMPVRFDGKIMMIAVSAPLDVKLQDEIRLHLGLQPKVLLTCEKDILDALKKYYGFAADMIDRILTKEPQRKVSDDDTHDHRVEEIDQKGTDASVAKLVNQIILEAYRKRATDIHIEPYRDKVRFRYRIDGALVDAQLPADVKHFTAAIISRIKIMANLSIVEKRTPQDGSAIVKTQEQTLDLRISTIPTPQGESIVVRILPTKVMKFKLEDLGLDNDNLDIFQMLIHKPHGVIFVTGPTGSGKTTTLYACLHEINSVERKIITIEDPVEYEMENITQIQVNPKTGLTFAAGLRSVLRHDPDIIMVGEVRDLETAEIAIRTALTGHLVFSTLHTNDAPSGVTRLIEMKIEPYLISSSIEGFVAQRLVRVICQNCKEEVPCPPQLKEEIAADLAIDNLSRIRAFQGKGCDRCNGTGYYGRTAIYEILVMNDDIRHAVFQGVHAETIKKIAVANGMRTLRQDGWRRVLQGITTPEEVMNVTSREQVPAVKSLEQAVLPMKPPISAKAPTSFQKNTVRLISRSELDDKKQDGRVYPRVDQKLNVLYRIFQSDPDVLVVHAKDIEYATTTRNISAGGVVIDSEKPLPVGSVIEIRIYFDDQKKESLECLAKVCRVEKEKDVERYHVVAYFLDISSADRNKLAQLVSQKMQSISNKK